MPDQEGKYNIKAVSSMLGIQPGTLRAWERRYKMIAPIRNESGHRLYTDEHIKTLKLILTKINQGFTISQAIAMLDDKQIKMHTDVENHIYEGPLLQFSEKLFDCLVRFDESSAGEVINTLFAMFSIEKVLIEVFSPILVKMGEYCEAGKLTSAHLQFASSFLKSRIILLYHHHNHPYNHTPQKALTVCGPGEWHDIGILILSLFLRRRGLEVIHLGANLIPGDFDKVISIINPKYLFISCTMDVNAIETLDIVKQLMLHHKDLRIGLGGAAFDSMKLSDKDWFLELIVGPTFDEWEKWLR